MNHYPCPYYRTIEHLRADDPQYGLSYGSFCNYSLGEGLFVNLDRIMNEVDFATALRDLYQRISVCRHDKCDLQQKTLSMDQGLALMYAFCSQCLQPNAIMGDIGHTLARRYGEKILTDNSTSIRVIAGLGSAQSASIVGYSDTNRQYGIAEVPASSPDQRRWLRMSFGYVPSPPATVRVGVKQYHEDRYPYYSYWQERNVYGWNG